MVGEFDGGHGVSLVRYRRNSVGGSGAVKEDDVAGRGGCASGVRSVCRQLALDTRKCAIVSEAGLHNGGAALQGGEDKQGRLLCSG